MERPPPRAWPLTSAIGMPERGTAGAVMSSPVVTVDAGVSLEQALARMDAHGIHHLLVTDGDHIVAVVSDRDLQRGLGIGPSRRDDERHRRRPLFQVASYRLVTIDEGASLAEAADALLTHGVSALPVITTTAGEPAIVGIVTSRDLLRHLAGTDGPRRCEGTLPGA